MDSQQAASISSAPVCLPGVPVQSLSVASITTSFNSVRVLPRQLDALLQQSRPLQEIIVVDNASTDETCSMLAQRYPQVKVLRMPENLGAAGAWAAGLAYAALERRYDWVWSFDDDSLPDRQALQLLLDGYLSLAQDNPSIGMVAPVPVHRATGTAYPPMFWKNGWMKPPPEILTQPAWLADLVILSGNLVRREVVEKIGLPRADFFMDFFDFEYCLRARSHGYDIAVINGCRFDHALGNGRQVALPSGTRLWSDYSPWREYYMIRNLVYAGWWLYPNLQTKHFAVRHLVRRAGGVLLFGSHRLACLTKMAQGFWDGCRARLGVRFRPF